MEKIEERDIGKSGLQTHFGTLGVIMGRMGCRKALRAAEFDRDEAETRLSWALLELQRLREILVVYEQEGHE